MSKTIRQFKCKACGAGVLGEKTREHVLPSYLRKRLREYSVKSLRTSIWNDSQVTPIREHDFDSLVARQVCASCNNGWMSDLENDFKPVLLRVLDGPQDLKGRLTEEERVLFARWTLKTSLMILAGQKGLPICWNHLAVMSQSSTSVPENCVVAAGFMSGKGLIFAYITQGEVLEIDGERQLANVSVGLFIESLHIVAVLPLDDNPRIASLSGKHYIVWPLRSPTVARHDPPEENELAMREFLSALTGMVKASVLLPRLKSTDTTS